MCLLSIFDVQQLLIMFDDLIFNKTSVFKEKILKRFPVSVKSLSQSKNGLRNLEHFSG